MILMYFQTKNTLKNNHYNNVTHSLNNNYAFRDGDLIIIDVYLNEYFLDNYFI
jgi:hypothetical protein